MAMDVLDINQECVWLTKYTAPKLDDSAYIMTYKTTKTEQMSVLNESKSSDFSSINTFLEKNEMGKQSVLKARSSRAQTNRNSDD